MENALFTNSAVSVRKLQISIGKTKMKYPWLFFLQGENRIAKNIVGELAEVVFLCSSRLPSLPLRSRNQRRS